MSLENPAVPLSALAEDSELFDQLTGVATTGAGVRMNRRIALGLSAVWRGVNLIAGDVGRHSFRVYAYDGAGLTPDRGHQAALVMRRPNEYMTPFTFRQTLQAHALLSGNGYAYILRDDAARPYELLPLDPDQTWPVRVNGQLWYVSQMLDAPVKGKRRGPKSMVKIPAPDMLHIKGLGFDGLVGYPVLKVLRETLGAAVAARDYGARYFLNDASPGIVLEVPAGMKDTAIVNLRESWSKIHQGFKKSHRPAILRDGVKLVPFAKATAKDAQMLESRAFDAREVANVLGIPPHKVGDPSRTAYNSLESENQGYQEDTLGRWFMAWEQECDSKLLTESEKVRESHCCKFDPRPLQGVPLAQQAAFFSLMFNIGSLNVDEIRAFMNLNPLPNGEGKIYRVPVNLAPAIVPDAQPAPAPVYPTPDPTPTEPGALTNG